MWPPSSVRLNLDMSLLLLLEDDVSLNPGPRVRNHCLDAVNAHSMRDKASAVISDLMTNKNINLLGITRTWLTSRETSADLAEVTAKDFSFSHKPRTQRRGDGVGLFFSTAHTFT